MAAVVDAAAWDHLQAGNKRLGLGASVRLHDPDNDIDPVAPTPLRRLQHLVGFADTRCGAQKNLETATLLAGRLLQQRFR